MFASIQTALEGRAPKLDAALGLLLLILLAPILIPVLFALLVFLFVYGCFLYMCVWLIWLPRGRDVLVIYSESPTWREYMTQQVLPRVRDRSMVLNWSERSRWSRWSLAVLVFRFFSGDGEFNPMVIVFRPLRMSKKFRYWKAFKAYKHGKPEEVEAITRELFDFLLLNVR